MFVVLSLLSLSMVLSVCLCLCRVSYVLVRHFQLSSCKIICLNIFNTRNVINKTMKQPHNELDFLIEENRRKTFKKWIFSDKEVCNADKMAEAGFIFIGNKHDPDSVKCFLCNKSLDGWDSTDDPWQEHLKHSTNCAFAKIQKPQDTLTLKEFLDIVEALNENIIKSYFAKKSDQIKDRFDEYEHKIMAALEK